ncbi:MAG: tRNA-uridine aminocarboxypropyltransferase [Telluria sp.]
MILSRQHCPCCTRPLPACICRWITPVTSVAGLLILQHPMETHNAKGSARLLHLSVAGSTIAQGEAFDPAQLRALLYAGGQTPLLLYPETPGEGGQAKSSVAGPALLANPAGLRLVVLDGTWRKSRKMLYQNPLLQALPRMPLTQMPPSHYLIRKAHAPDQLSTLEASCYALGQLHGDAVAFQPLLDAFDRFVAHFQQTGGKLDALPNHA